MEIPTTVLKKLSKKAARRSPGCCFAGAVGGASAILAYKTMDSEIDGLRQVGDSWGGETADRDSALAFLED